MITDPQLVPLLRELYCSLPRKLSADELPLGEFLRCQGAVSTESPELVEPGLRLEPKIWADLRQAGEYVFPGDGEGGRWRYHYRPGESACLACLLRRWVERHHGAQWWARLQAWPDFCLSWAAAERLAEPELAPGWLHYQRGDRNQLGQVFPYAGCDCLSLARWPRHWGSWSHPVTGPLTSIVQRHARGLWRVSLHLHEAVSSGASPKLPKARRAAVAEACERWAALQACPVEKLPVRRLGGGKSRRCWSGLVYLGPTPRPHGQQLSHGLACGTSLGKALRSGLWELLERDGLRRWWKDWLCLQPTSLWRHGPRLWSLPARVGRVFLAYAGRDGKGAWGSAAGPEAARRATYEARHNYHLQRRRPPALLETCLSFADHAAWAWHHPLPRWEEMCQLPLTPLPLEAPDWREAARVLPIYYYQLECPWAERLGWTVVKVLSPRLHGLKMGGQAPFHPFP